MLIDLHLLFEGGRILLVVACITFFGTAGKALAAYLAGGSCASTARLAT